MIPLGNARHDNLPRICQAAARLVRNHVRAAVLLAKSGQAYAVLHHEPAFGEALNAGPHLCGVYQVEPEAEDDASQLHPYGLAATIRGDMLQSWKELRRA